MTIGSGKQDEELQKSRDAQIINLSQEVEVYNSRISAFEEKVQLMELKYKKMACLFAKTIENPIASNSISRKSGEFSTEMEQTFIMIKSDGAQRGLVGEIISRFEKKGFTLRVSMLTAPLLRSIMLICLPSHSLTSLLSKNGLGG